jgi:hypothetical protein
MNNCWYGHVLLIVFPGEGGLGFSGKVGLQLAQCRRVSSQSWKLILVINHPVLAEGLLTSVGAQQLTPQERQNV